MPTYNLARFDFVSIRLVVLCAKAGNLTTAARECNVALPAASRRIKDLEMMVGCQLFERHSRGLLTTPAGRIFARHGFMLLQEMDALATELNDLQKGITRHIQLFANTAAINQFLPPLMAKYAALQPAVQLDLEEEVSEQVVLALRESRADIGIFVVGAHTDGLDLLDVRDFRKDELVLILPQTHKLVSKTSIAFVDTLDEIWISLTQGAALLQQQQNAALAVGRQLKLRMQVKSFDAVGHMVAAGLGIAMLPKLAAMPIVHAMKLRWRPLRDDWAQRSLKVGIRKEADSVVVSFRDFLCKSSQNTKAYKEKYK